MTLLAYAQLKEKLEQKNEAIWLYQRAAKTHPEEPSVYNNMGLFYAGKSGSMRRWRR